MGAFLGKFYNIGVNNTQGVYGPLLHGVQAPKGCQVPKSVGARGHYEASAWGLFLCVTPMPPYWPSAPSVINCGAKPGRPSLLTLGSH